MAEISNNLIAGLLIVAILISIVGLANTLTLMQYPVKYTGAATTGTGKANVTIESALSIRLLRNESWFGSGYPNSQGGGILEIWSNNTAPNWDGTAGTGSFNNGSEGNGTDYNTGTHVYPFVVENNGNDPNTCIRVYADKTAQQFIGGAAQTPEFRFAGKNNESAWGSTNTGCSGSYPDACTSGLVQTWTDMGTSSTTVCTTLNSSQCSDEIRIHFLLGIPEDAAGSKTATVTVAGCNPCGAC